MNISASMIYRWAKDLFPICRSITGNGVRETLAYIKEIVSELSIYEVKTGENVFDWTIPLEWNCCSGHIIDPNGEIVVDFENNNLHVMSYSEPIDKVMSLVELDKHLYSIKDIPDAIPYKTSYYNKDWGFCLSDQKRQALINGDYKVVIDSTLEPGSLSFADILIQGETDQEILLSTYTCHPSMANNETSGMVIATALALWLKNLPHRRYTYRIVFVPETIGAVAYLHKNYLKMKEKTIAGFVITCVGDNRDYSYLPSRNGDTYADRIARFTLDNYVPSYTEYSFMDRGSDECQYCSPMIDLPVASMMRTKYHEYPEYHTSKDDLTLISEEGLGGAFDMYKNAIKVLEKNRKVIAKNPCEPQMSKRPGLRNPLVDFIKLDESSKLYSNILAYADGENDFIALAKKNIGAFDDIVSCAEVLKENELIKYV